MNETLLLETEDRSGVSRRDFLSILVTTAILTLAGCGGGGGGGNSQPTEPTALDVTIAAGYTVEYDNELSSPGRPFVKTLKKNGEVILTGRLYFTVNGQRFDDGDGLEGNKTVLSKIEEGSTVDWHKWPTN